MKYRSDNVGRFKAIPDADDGAVLKGILGQLIQCIFVSEWRLSNVRSARLPRPS